MSSWSGGQGYSHTLSRATAAAKYEVQQDLACGEQFSARQYSLARQLNGQFRDVSSEQLAEERAAMMRGEVEMPKFNEFEPLQWHDKDLQEALPYRQLLKVGRHTKVMGGGRIFSVSALVLVGNRNGTAGFGYGKALTMVQALQRANRDAEKNLITIDRFEDRTVSVGEMRTKYKGAIVVVRNAARGRGLTCNVLIRQICEAFGIEDLSANTYGSRNPHNVIKAVFKLFMRSEHPKSSARFLGKVFFDRNRIIRRPGIHHSFSV